MLLAAVSKYAAPLVGAVVVALVVAVGAQTWRLSLSRDEIVELQSSNLKLVQENETVFRVNQQCLADVTRANDSVESLLREQAKRDKAFLASMSKTSAQSESLRQQADALLQQAKLLPKNVCEEVEKQMRALLIKQRDK